ncbi:MAG TPA: AAA family ATPase [Candidatus Sulfotelmatobacter sp.]|nr:AAA family ATPase [Candidatus Sulfotelmatobacter sp.]
MSAANEVWGRPASELLTRKVEPWNFDKAGFWAAETITYMLADGESDQVISRRIAKTIKACADENTQLRFTPDLIKRLIATRSQDLLAWKKVEPEKNWLADADEFLAREIAPRKSILTDRETGATVLFEKSINQIFAFRGLGKSVVANALIKVVTKGGDFLRFQSEGGHRTLLVDAELPAVQLQERLREFTGAPKGMLRILSPELMPNPKQFPVLSDPPQQAAFLDQIEEFGPSVIIFDTLTRVFKFDSNDADAWIAVNDFLLDLRFRGYCVVLIHHAGKNGTQRGLTMGDDNLDVAIQLDKRYGWLPGDGLQFVWKYEKVRHGGHLPEFEAEYNTDTRTWEMGQDDRTAEVIEMASKGKTQRGIALAMEMSPATVNRILKRARQQGVLNLNEKHGEKA